MTPTPRGHGETPAGLAVWLTPLSVRGAAVTAISIALIVLLVTLALPNVRVGDGSEYYGLYLAWKDGHRPFMTESAFRAYEAFFGRHDVADLVTTDVLRKAFPPLIQGNTADFNHFWFYPGIVLVIGGWLDLLGAGPHIAFVFTNVVLLALLLFVYGRCFGRSGIIASVVTTCASPMIWFVDKAHTEFFTFTLIAIATALFGRRRYFLAALALAIASTQNISIAATSGFALAMGAWDSGWLRLRFRVKDVALALLTIVIVLLHPAYYIARVGVIDPQLLAGGAKVGTNLSSAFIWLIDPDVGLLPNWPLCLVIVALGFAAYRRGLFAWSWRIAAFVGVFVVTNLYAQASTQTLNSGATVYIARYATWYIGLFIPLLALGLAAAQKFEQWKQLALAALFGGAVVANAVVFWPARHETYMQPTALSEFVQRFLPYAYDPPPQIFGERFLGAGPDASSRSYAILGPDCRKLVVVKKDGVPVLPLPRHVCNLDVSAYPQRVLSPDRWDGVMQDGRRYVYLHLTDDEQRAASPVLHPGQHYRPVAGERSAAAFLDGRWYPPESAGTWSHGSVVGLGGPIESCREPGLRLFLTLTPFKTPKNPEMSLEMTVGDHTLGKKRLEGAGTYTFDVPCAAVQAGEIHFDLHIDGNISPFDAGISQDKREIGIYLHEFWLDGRGS